MNDDKDKADKNKVNKKKALDDWRAGLDGALLFGHEPEAIFGFELTPEEVKERFGTLIPELPQGQSVVWGTHGRISCPPEGIYRSLGEGKPTTHQCFGVPIKTWPVSQVRMLHVQWTPVVSAVDAYTSVYRDVALGDHGMGSYQTRTHYHGPWDYRVETSELRAPIWGRFAHPSVNDLFSDVEACAKIAATASVLVFVATGQVAAGLVIFKPAFLTCIASKVQDRLDGIHIELYKGHEYWSCWTHHC